jgi:hypothetical protein
MFKYAELIDGVWTIKSAKMFQAYRVEDMTEEDFAVYGLYSDTRKPFDPKPELLTLQKHDAGQVINGRVVWSAVDMPLEDAQALKVAEISAAFDTDMRTGSVMTPEEWSIDARRSDTKNDLQNMDTLYRQMLRNGETEAYVKGADNELHLCTLAQVEALVILLEDAGAARYLKKFSLESQIYAATTVDQLRQVVWS